MCKLTSRPFVSAVAVSVLAFLAEGTAMALEQPKYTVVSRDSGVEFRQYQDYLVVETEVTGSVDFDAAGNEGFRRLFRYITGANDGGSDIAMTAPVTQDMPGVEIAMTAPVAQDAMAGGWRVAFMLPASYTLKTAPRPTDKRVSIRRVPGELVASVRYSGRWTSKNVENYTARLRTALQVAGVTAIGKPLVARYDPPYMPPFLRRNEISIPVDRAPGTGSARPL